MLVAAPGAARGELGRLAVEERPAIEALERRRSTWSSGRPTPTSGATSVRSASCSSTDDGQRLLPPARAAPGRRRSRRGGRPPPSRRPARRPSTTSQAAGRRRAGAGRPGAARRRAGASPPPARARARVAGAGRLPRRRHARDPRLRVPRRRADAVRRLASAAPRMTGTAVRALARGHRHHRRRRARELVACERGVITRMGTNVLGGITLWLRGESGVSYYYAHLSGFAPGVTRAWSSRPARCSATSATPATPAATPPHLHFEVHPERRRGGQPVPAARRRRQDQPQPEPIRLDLAPALDRRRWTSSPTSRRRTRPTRVWAVVSDLGTYPRWLDIVPACRRRRRRRRWTVDLRGRLGPFARSKRLRMVRTGRRGADGWPCSSGPEHDGRQHSPVGAAGRGRADRRRREPADDAPALRRLAVRPGARAPARRHDRAQSRPRLLAARSRNPSRRSVRPDSFRRGHVGSAGDGPPAVVAALEAGAGRPKVADSASAVSTSSSGPAATTPPVARGAARG